MKLRIVKRWNERAGKFLFHVQQWEDDTSFDPEGWVDRCGPYETHEDARRIVTTNILNNNYETDIVIEEF